MSRILALTTCVSHPGSAHLASGKPCQDASNIVSTGKNFDIIILAASDGAGSAKYSEAGSKAVVETIINFFLETCYDLESPEEYILELDKSDIALLMQDITSCVSILASEKEANLSEFSATAIGAIVNQKCAFFFQVGDGCLVYHHEDSLKCATWPEHGSQAGETVFVTCHDSADHIQTLTVDGEIDFVIAFTDGIERIALDLKERKPSQGFFFPLIRGLLQYELDANDRLRQWLASEVVCSRTDDDKTIVSVILNDSCLQ